MTRVAPPGAHEPASSGAKMHGGTLGSPTSSAAISYNLPANRAEN
jgi:hypothetical protein